ncbi:MAG: hypothetical protein HQL69_06230 [Magnetococcales bacterium]|nr:hypothetical protein [Magnetococcales bacterium]
MNDNILFDDIRQYTKRLDRHQSTHPIVPILLSLGIKKGTVTKYLTEANMCGRSSGFNLMSGSLAKVSREMEEQLLLLLKQSLQQSIKVAKNYKKFHKLGTIEQLNRAILSGKYYLESIDESIDIDFQGLCEPLEIEGITDDGLMAYIEHAG